MSTAQKSVGMVHHKNKTKILQLWLCNSSRVASLVTYDATESSVLYHICSFAHSYFVSKLLPSSSSVPSADVVDLTDAHPRVVWPVHCIYKACYTVRLPLLYTTRNYVHCTYHQQTSTRMYRRQA
jgi:hypothetical protein